jgi:Pin2-interacting protein X1
MAGLQSLLVSLSQISRDYHVILNITCEVFPPIGKRLQGMAVATMTAHNETATFQGIDRNVSCCCLCAPPAPLCAALMPPIPARMLHVGQELAYKLVAKMGWEEGKGLGRDNKGIVKHIWTKKRNDQVGLGGEVGNDWGAHSIQTNTYNSLLSKLAVITNNSDDSDDSESDSGAEAKSKKKKARAKEARSKKDKKQADSDSDEEAARKKAKKNKKKSKKVESSSDADSSDEDVSKAASASCDDYGGGARKAGRSYAAAAVKESKQAKASVTALRYAYKRAHMNKTKDVSSYSVTDLSQILGFSVAPKEEDKALLQRDGVKKYSKAGSARGKADEASSSSDEDESDKEDRGGKKRKGGGEDKAERKGGIVLGSSKRKPMVLPEPSKLKGVLMHMFSHGGFLSGDTKQKEQDWQFDEATQEKIAVDAHNNKVTGKKGLGFDNDRPSKLGKDYTGSKKTFDDSDDEVAGKKGGKEEKDESADEEESEEERKKRRKAEKRAKKAKEAQDAAIAEEVASPREKDKKRKKKAREDEGLGEEQAGDEDLGGKKKKKKSKKQKSE